mgnify:CR=1 FL=1
MPVSRRTAALAEEWREVPGDEYIRVSSLGRIMRGMRLSCPRTNVYLRGGRSMAIYHLVLLVFVGPCPEGMECCHRDDNRTNNALSNLRWDTRSENLHDRWRNGRGGKTGAVGENCGSSKLTDDAVRLARQLRLSSSKIWTYERLANKFGVTKRAMILAVSRRTWRHVL